MTPTFERKVPPQTYFSSHKDRVYLCYRDYVCVYQEGFLAFALALIKEAKVPVHDSGIQLLSDIQDRKPDKVAFWVGRQEDHPDGYMYLEPEGAIAYCLSGLQLAMKIQQVLKPREAK